MLNQENSTFIHRNNVYYAATQLLYDFHIKIKTAFEFRNNSLLELLNQNESLYSSHNFFLKFHSIQQINRA